MARKRISTDPDKKYHGVKYNVSSKKYAALYQSGTISYKIGLYSTPEEAAIAYDDELYRLHLEAASAQPIIYNFGPPNDPATSTARQQALANAATAAQNKFAPKLSKYRGVSKSASGNFIAQYKHNGVMYYLGTFAQEEDAARAYDHHIGILIKKLKAADPGYISRYTYNFGDPNISSNSEQSSTDLNSQHDTVSRLKQNKGMPGISWYNARQVWKANIQHHGKKTYIGNATTYHAAVKIMLAKLEEMIVTEPNDIHLLTRIAQAKAVLALPPIPNPTQPIVRNKKRKIDPTADLDAADMNQVVAHTNMGYTHNDSFDELLGADDLNSDLFADLERNENILMGRTTPIHANLADDDILFDDEKLFFLTEDQDDLDIASYSSSSTAPSNSTLLNKPPLLRNTPPLIFSHNTSSSSAAINRDLQDADDDAREALIFARAAQEFDDGHLDTAEIFDIPWLDINLSPIDPLLLLDQYSAIIIKTTHNNEMCCFLRFRGASNITYPEIPLVCPTQHLDVLKQVVLNMTHIHSKTQPEDLGTTVRLVLFQNYISSSQVTSAYQNAVYSSHITCTKTGVYIDVFQASLDPTNNQTSRITARNTL